MIIEKSAAESSLKMFDKLPSSSTEFKPRYDHSESNQMKEMEIQLQKLEEIVSAQRKEIDELKGAISIRSNLYYNDSDNFFNIHGYGGGGEGNLL